MSRLMAVPVPVRMKLTRNSLRARASRAPLLNFSYMTGTKRRNKGNKMPVTETKSAKPVSPAVDQR